MNETMENFNETGTFVVEEREHLPSVVFMMVVMGFGTLVGLSGNIVVAGLISTRRKLQSITNIYILHKCLADIFAQSLNPVLIASIAQDNFPFGYPFCILTSYLIQGGYIVSLVFLVLLAIDCYLATRPQFHTIQYRWKVLKIGVGVTWGAGVLFLIPVYFFTDFYMTESYRHYCFEGPLFTTNMALLEFLFMYSLIFAPMIVLWVFISFIYPAQKEAPIPGPVIEGEDDADSKESTSPPRALLLSLAVTMTMLQMPYWIIKSFNEFGLYSFMTHIVFICLFELLYPINPLLYIYFRKDLWQRVIGFLPSHPTSTLPLENL